MIQRRWREFVVLLIAERQELPLNGRPIAGNDQLIVVAFPVASLGATPEIIFLAIQPQWPN